ncbi:hypothetical protein [Aeromicrobium sp. Sec7.5]|uniref:hypothetical protein n=1 Tax=Aeromicrobium sp. Sec7.5 TaxID=3121276 RepID=UPI002FE4A7FD
MSATVQKVTYARVAKDATPGTASIRPHDSKLDAFLLEHVEALQGFANGKNSCPAVFVDPASKTSFEALRDGNDAEFLQAAHDLTLQLIGQMTGSTAEGLLVCVQLHDGQAAAAAVLKLQVVTPNAANLQTLDSGEQLLSAVTNVMDAPGKLQKGALLDDPQPGSDVVVGDVASKEAQYFPRALGISIEERPGQAAIAMLDVIKDLQGDAVEVASRNALPNLSAGTVSDVLTQLSTVVPELQPTTVRDEVSKKLAARARPVRNVETTAPLTEHITASGVTIKVPITGQDRVSIEQDKVNGGYKIIIRVDEHPKREVR